MNRALRALLLAGPVQFLALLATSACVDGYPKNDVPRFDVGQMSQSERIAKMNLIGQGHPGSARFQYAFGTDCSLTIERVGTVTTRHSVALAHATIEMRSAKDAEPYRVVASRSGGTPIDIYEGSNRINAMHMDTTVKLLRRDCIAAAPALR